MGFEFLAFNIRFAIAEMTALVLLIIGALSIIFDTRADPVLSGGLLYPRESPTRERKVLNGLWDFRACSYTNQSIGFDEKWYEKPLRQTGEVIPMPVPASYNEITQSPQLRDYVGWVWYETDVFVPARWNATNQRVLLYFGAAQYTAIVWLNGINVLNHTIGHLPFQAEVDDALKYGTSNRLTVALNSTLTSSTVPQGFITYFNDATRYPPGFFEVSYNFDFSNYAGIDRPVYFYVTPTTFIDDLTITTDYQGTDGIISYVVIHVTNLPETPNCTIQILDKNSNKVAEGSGLQGQITIPNVNLWWPVFMNSNPGYLYTMVVTIVSSDGSDTYYERFGVRKVGWTNTTLTINNKPFYFRGFGKHEDYPIRGKGMDHSFIAKDFNLIKWIGANSFRTSHYPYADEIMDRADEEGVVVIDESPGCTLSIFGSELLENHKRAMAELIRRDKNRPSVIMWSLANEPDSGATAADAYFQSLTAYTRTLDATRPITVVVSAGVSSDKASQYCDVVCVNRYYAWYSDTGHLELITLQMETEYQAWYNKFHRPVMTTEYGADAVVGLHTDPPYVFTEDYQVALMRENFKAFDQLRSKGYFIGEMIWNFADFMTPQGTTRVVGNKKGMFTRDRQPKASAHALRGRYWTLANVIDNVTGIIDTEMCSQFSSNEIYRI